MKTRHDWLSPRQVQDRVALYLFGTVILSGIFLSGLFYLSTTARGDLVPDPVIVDDNLTNTKPTPWWRLNSNGYSQRYIPLVGVGREERMRELLSHYGHDNYEVWKTIARVYRVYPEILICIAYADSSLGRFLKTDNNFGNVWNNDRGDTVSFSTAEAGINAIGKVLNNRYLWWYTLVSELSPYENTSGTWPYYATSQENRGINVLNCLGMIYDKEIVADWNYRW